MTARLDKLDLVQVYRLRTELAQDPEKRRAFGRWMLSGREHAGLLQREVGAIWGVSSQTISRFEAGKLIPARATLAVGLAPCARFPGWRWGWGGEHFAISPGTAEEAIWDRQRLWGDDPERAEAELLRLWRQAGANQRGIIIEILQRSQPGFRGDGRRPGP